MDDTEMDRIIANIKDQNLKLTLAFGVGIHHAGLVERDRRTVEELYVNMKIQVLIATATVAWGVNFPAHLVIVKGTGPGPDDFVVEGNAQPGEVRGRKDARALSVSP